MLDRIHFGGPGHFQIKLLLKACCAAFTRSVRSVPAPHGLPDCRGPVWKACPREDEAKHRCRNQSEVIPTVVAARGERSGSLPLEVFYPLACSVVITSRGRDCSRVSLVLGLHLATTGQSMAESVLLCL